MGGGKSSASSSQVQVPAEVLARYNSVNTRAEQAASTPFQSYSSDPNAFVAPLTGTQQSGIANTNNAAGMAQPFFTRGAQLTQAGARSADPNAITGREIGQYFSPFMNSVFASQLAGQEQQNAQQRSGLQGEAIKSGAFGGDRAGIAAGNLAYQQNLANSQSNAQLLNSGFGTALATAQQQQGVDLTARQADLARQLGAGAQIAQIGSGAQTAALTGANAQLTAGGQEQQTQQAGLSALYNQFLQQQGHPYQQAQFLANIAEGTGALSGSSTSSTQPASFFSDERLKEDIEKIGKTFDGQNIIKFRYRGDPRMRIGLSAQEVERHHPEAVGKSHGYRTVDYDAATEDAAERGHFQRGGMAFGGGTNDNVTKAMEMLRSYGMEGSAGPYGITPRPRAQRQELMTPKLPAPQKSEFQEGLQAVHSVAGAVGDVKKLKSAAGELYDWAKPGEEDTSNWPVPPIPPEEVPGLRRGGGVKGYAIGGTPYGDEGYIPEPIEPPRPPSATQTSSSSGGGGGGSDLATLASIAGVAAMFLSDERLKEDIEKIGKTFDGQNIIKFRYRGDPRVRIGLSAQEVERHHPEAVGRAHGYRTVDYDAATEDAAKRGRFQRGGTPYEDEGYIPEPIEPPRSLPVAQPPSSSGGGGSSDLASIASLAKIASLFLKNGGVVERRHRTPGGGVGPEGVDEGTWDLPEPPPRGVDAVLSSLRAEQPAARSRDFVDAIKNPDPAFRLRQRETDDAGTWDLPEQPSRGVAAVPSSLRAEQSAARSLGDPRQRWTNDAEAVYQGFRARGYDDATARGFAANAVQESGARYNPPAGDGGRSRGLFQLNGPRLDAYRTRYGHDPEQGSLDEALDFAHFELQGSEGKALAAINAAGNTPGDKAKAISTYFLRPKDTAKEETQRAAIANQNGVAGDSYLDKFARMVGLGGGDAATPRTAAAAGEKSSPNWVERNQDWLVPVLSGLGGMAASPSRFLAGAVLQGLGTGAQSYEDVQNKVAQRGKVAEETAAIPERVAVSKQTAQTAEDSKRMELLIMLRKSAGAYIASGKPIPEELQTQISALAKSLNRNAAPAGQPRPDATATPSVGEGALTGTGTPTVSNAATIPPVAAPPATTAPPAASASPAPTVSPAASVSPATAAAAPVPPMSDPFASSEFSKNVAPGSDPLKLEEIAYNLAGTDPELSEKYRVRAEKLRESIAATGKVLGANNVMIDVPGWADAETRKENVASNRKALADMATTDAQRKVGRNSLDAMRKTLQSYRSGSLNDTKAAISAFSTALGGPKLDSATMSPEDYQTLIKEAYKNIFSGIKEIGGRPLVAEITALEKAVASPTLAPEANRKILSQAVGILDYADKFYTDMAAAYHKDPALSPSQFQVAWAEKNPLSAFTDKAYLETPVRGATPKSLVRDGKPGAQYVIEPGTIPGATKHKIIRYLGVDKASGKPLVEDVD